MAYETAENKIMERAPRNPARDRLASHKLLFQSYAQIGMLEVRADKLADVHIVLGVTNGARGMCMYM